MSLDTTGLTLDADDLFDKGGFLDGALIDDWWESIHGGPPEFDTEGVLSALVQRHLVPAIERAGRAVEVTRIVTLHNPVRATRLDGTPVSISAPREPRFLPPIRVDVTPKEIAALLRAAGG